MGATIIGKTRQSITDEYGYFKLDVASSSKTLNVSHLGYNPLTISVSESTLGKCENYYLIPRAEPLSEIILRNYIVKGIDKIADGSFSINFSNFGVLPGLIEADVLQTIQALPGVQSATETVSNINIRGGTNDQNLVLWDGIKMYQTGHFFGLISAFHPQMTTDAKLIKNGTNPAYSDGVSGSIFMQTDSKIANKLSANLGVNFINADLMVDIPLGEKSSLQLASRKAVDDFIDTPTFKKYFDRIEQDTELEQIIRSENTFDFYDASMRWLFRPTAKDFIKLSGIFLNNKLTASGTATTNNLVLSKENSLAQESMGAGLLYERNWNDSFSTSLNITGSKYTIDATNEDLTEDSSFTQENKVLETSVKLNAIYEYNSNLSFSTGYHFTETGVTNITERPEFQLSVKEVIREHALFSQARYTAPSKKTFINIGARYNLIDFLDEPIKHRVEPRLSITHKLLNHFTIEIQGELKHQNTAQIIRGQDDFLGIERRRWIPSNNFEEDIPVLTSLQLSFGTTYSNKGWLANIEGYYKEVDDIVSLSQGFVNQFSDVLSIGSYEVYGLDVLINKRLKYLNTWLTYTYANNNYFFEGLAPQKFPNNIDIRHVLGFGSSYNIKNFEISAGINWHSGLPTTLPLEANPIVDEAINYEVVNSSRVDDYVRIDFSANYNFKISEAINATTGVSFWNLTNNSNTISNYFRPENNVPVKVSTQALAFTPNFVFRVFF